MMLATPLALWLLLLLPPLVWLGWPRQRFRRARDTASTILRVLILLCIVLALSGVQLSQSADRLAVVFLVDVSDSLGPELQEAQLAWVEQAMEAMGPDDLAGIVAFGARPYTERVPGTLREPGALQSQPSRSNTDLAAAIRHGSALLPGDAARRLVILSDGRATLGDAPAAARQAAASGIEISHVVFARPPGPEVQLTALDAPAVVSADQPFDVTLSVLAGANTDAALTVLDNGNILQRETLQLRAGANNFTLTLPGSGDGFRDIRARIDPQGSDGFYQNNQLATFTRVVGPPRALLLTEDDAEALHLLPALEQAGVIVEHMRPRELPLGLAPLLQYESVILANLSATALGRGRMEALERYVRDLGGGLVAIGGPDAFAPGGWYQTPLEDLLPLEMQIRDQQRLPQLTITYLIDRSGSMGMRGPSGVANIELAKEAIIRSLDFLQPSDRAGVVSFDTVGTWIAELQPVLDRLGLQRLVATLRAGGGTDILAGMRLVAQAISDEPSQRKHVILLTDGGAKPDGLVELSEAAQPELGRDYLGNLHRRGGGVPAGDGGGRRRQLSRGAADRQHPHHFHHGDRAGQSLLPGRGAFLRAADRPQPGVERHRWPAGPARLRRQHPQTDRARHSHRPRPLARSAAGDLAIRPWARAGLHQRRGRALGLRLDGLGRLSALLGPGLALDLDRGPH